MKNLVNLLPSLDLDVVVNNAVTSLNKNHFHKIESHDFLLSFQNNILPTLQITQECIKIFRKKKFGKIINIASSYVINKPPMGLSEYVANKAYLISMSNSWAIENIRFNITSNSISPTYMQTQFTSETDERIVEEMIKNHALKKLLTTEEVADNVLYFVNCTQHINGVNLLINAGDDLV
jgi:NAD(P)-dependent dehydrogenase (short-subunit alcohol dehydrogenase family)